LTKQNDSHQFALFCFKAILENVTNDTAIFGCVLRNFSKLRNVSSNTFCWGELENVSSRMQNVVSVFIVEVKLKIDLIQICDTFFYQGL
jgi:hypothetical protein